MAEPRIPNPTLKQRTAYDLRAKGLTWEAIGAQMGCVSQTARNHVLGAVKRGLQPILSEKMFVRRLSPNAGEPRRVERMKDGEGMFDVGVTGTIKFDIEKFREMAASAGIPPRIAGAIARRVEDQLGVAKKEFKAMSLNEEMSRVQEIKQELLENMDVVSIGAMNAKDLALAYGIMTDKKLLLGGKPTSIVDFNVRARLEVLMPAMLAEAARRGITMDGTFTKVSETENDDSQPARIESASSAATAAAASNDHDNNDG